MDTSYARSQVDSAKIYSNIQALKTLRAQAKDYNPEAIKKVAKQFESLFMQMMMKSMRDANSVFKSELSSGSETETFEEMYHQQLSLNLSGKGMGIADMLERHLTKYYQPKSSTKTVELKAPTLFSGQTVSATKGDKEINDSEWSNAVEKIRQFGSADEFVEKLLPYAKKAAAVVGVDPKLLLAQAALETGWGRAIIGNASGSNSHNLFGIKAHDWQGQTASSATHEYKDDQRISTQADFRQYRSYQESFDDYLNFLHSNPRYSKALENSHSPKAFTEELQRAGYATDPAYARKILQLYHSPAIQAAKL